jgi:hypothetical protein
MFAFHNDNLVAPFHGDTSAGERVERPIGWISTRSLRGCEKIEIRPRGLQRIAGGKLSAAPGWQATSEWSLGGAAQSLSWQSVLSPLPGLVSSDSQEPQAALRLPGAILSSPLRGSPVIVSQPLPVAALTAPMFGAAISYMKHDA